MMGFIPPCYSVHFILDRHPNLSRQIFEIVAILNDLEKCVNFVGGQ
jgi:hypothetical protein